MAAAERRFYQRYSGRVIAVSRKIADELREFYGFAGQISVIHHGIDAASIESTVHRINRIKIRRELGFRSNETVALYVGDLTKAHTYLKQLAAELPRVKLLIVTKSTRYHWTSANVKIVPATDEIARYYAAADAFVFPTTYDAFGLVVLEAMAAGLPVSTSDRAGAAEIMTCGEDGFVFRLNEWVQKTAGALGNPADFLRISAAARETARKHNWQNVTGKVEQVYQEVATATEAASVETFSNEYCCQRS